MSGCFVASGAPLPRVMDARTKTNTFCFFFQKNRKKHVAMPILRRRPQRVSLFFCLHPRRCAGPTVPPFGAAVLSPRCHCIVHVEMTHCLFFRLSRLGFCYFLVGRSANYARIRKTQNKFWRGPPNRQRMTDYGFPFSVLVRGHERACPLGVSRQKKQEENGRT
nr:hypothetical protein [Pandoravirus massiliensis]